MPLIDITYFSLLTNANNLQSSFAAPHKSVPIVPSIHSPEEERLLGPACWMWGEAGVFFFYCLYLYDIHDQTAVFVLFTPTPIS